MVDEIFKVHPFLGYEISNKGKIKGKKVKYLKLGLHNGYRVVNIGRSNILRKTTCFVHRLVVETFIGEIPKGLVVNHIDGDKLNNNIENLEIVTYSENTIHALKLGLMTGKKGQENSMAKLLTEDVIDIYNMIKEGKSNAEIGLKYNLHSRYVSLIRHGKRWKELWVAYFNEDKKIISGDSNNLDMNFCLGVLKTCLDKSLTNKFIARKYEIDPSTISRIRSRKTWQAVWAVYEVNLVVDMRTESFMI